MAPDRSKAGGNRNRPDILTDPRAIQRVHLDHHQISSHQNVVKTIKDTPITDLADVEVDKTSDDFAAGQSLVWGGDSWIAGDPEVLIPVKAGEEMTKGTPVYVSGEQASGKPIVSKADSDGTGTYPAIGLLLTDLAAGDEGHAVGGGIISGLDTDSYAVGDALYLSSSPGVLTNTRPLGANEKVQKVAVVARSHPEAGTVIVMGAGRTNDVPNELTTLTGVSLGDSDLGTFNATIYGVRIPDNSDNKEAFQYLSTTLDAAYEEARQATNGVSGLDADLQALVTYHGRYDTEAETARSGATAETVEVYYTARPDGDGLAESEVTTSTPAGFVIERKLYFSDKFNADPDTASDWTLYTTQPADNTAFATAKASLLAGLSDTDATANTRGTLPVSLKMTHRFSQDLLLEDFPGAAAAYSLRKISTNYTGSAIRIREDGTNTEADIGFDSNGDLDTAAIATHCGSNNGFVKTWYDQSGNGNDISQAAVGNQPEIYDGSNVHTSNGKPSVAFDQSTLPYLFTSVFTTSTTASVAIVCQHAVDATTRGIYENGSSNGHSLAVGASTDYYQWSYQGVAAYNSSAGSAVANTQTLLFGRTISGSSHDLWKDGSSILSTTPGTMGTPSGSFWIGAINAVTPINGRVQEFVLWDNDQSANRTDIEADISAYWQSNKRTLDAYPGAAAAYSVRKLDNDYTGSALRVREDSGNTETDIGFDSNGNLDTAAIASHCGSANGFVVTWYDQSGNGQNVSNATTTQQPQIYNGTATILENGRPALDGAGASTLTCSISLVSQPITLSSVVAGSLGGYVCDTTGGRLIMYREASEFAIYNGVTLSYSATVSGQIVAMGLYNGTSSKIAIDGSEVASGDAGTGGASGTLSVFSRRNATSFHAGLLQEFVLWGSDEYTSNRSGIESDIDTYYKPTTQLLIDTYSGAAAAYSVRKLSQWYTGSCMRIREDSGDTETDIGFDSNGDLDTAAIASHCGSANGYVVTWYDQSGNSRDATAAADTNEPKIYDGTTGVHTTNGKPAIDFAGDSIFLNYATSTLNLGTNDHLVAGVVEVGTTANTNQVWFEEENGGSARYVLWWQNNNTLQLYHNTVVGTGYSSTKGQQYLLTAERVGTSSKLYIDGSLGPNGTAADFTSSGNDLKIGTDNFETANQSWDGTMQEIIAWPSDQSANRTDIESNINTYFSIYP